jgi:hypothetical protein
MDSVYRLASTLPHTADTLTLNFLAMGLNPDLAEESWGLANVQVFITPTAPAFQLIPLGLALNGQFQLRLTGESGRSYVIEASSDLRSWTPMRTNTITGGSVDILDPDTAGYGCRFYRAFAQ